MTPYLEFLRGKMKMAPASGFDVPMAEINPALKPFTREILRCLAQGPHASYRLWQAIKLPGLTLAKIQQRLQALRQYGAVHHRGGWMLATLTDRVKAAAGRMIMGVDPATDAGTGAHHVLFFREGCFYPVALCGAKPTYEEVVDHVVLNPGTLRVEEVDGRVIWPRALS